VLDPRVDVTGTKDEGELLKGVVRLAGTDGGAAKIRVKAGTETLHIAGMTSAEGFAAMFDASGLDAGKGFAVGNIAIVTPLPGAVLMFGAGLVGLGAWRRFQRA
jgi:hypothetical protein